MSRLEDGMKYEPRDPKYGYTASSVAYERAKREELEVITPAPNQLLVDIDGAPSLRIFEKQLGVLYEMGMVIAVESRPSQSGLEGHIHSIITLTINVTEPERIALQACLGSDRRCEILRFQRYLVNDPQPTLFLEKRAK
jgi:hypothetical protein